MKTLDPLEFVKEYHINSVVCCFSGGKDSLVATHYVLSQIEDLAIDKYVVLADTTIMLPVAIDYAKDVASKLGWNFHIVKPSQDFFEQAKIKGMPWHKRRWCCAALKLFPIRDFVKKLPPQRAEVTGLRKDESLRREQILKRQILYDKRIPSWKYAPILFWTERQVLAYIKNNGLPMPPHYKMGFRETCMCGVYASKKELLTLKFYYPEMFQKFVDLEKEFRCDWACWWYSHKPLKAQELAKQQNL